MESVKGFLIAFFETPFRPIFFFFFLRFVPVVEPLLRFVPFAEPLLSLFLLRQLYHGSIRGSNSTV